MTKILYIAGWGRSGTTLLDNLLGQVDGFANVGELHHLWQRGLIEDRACGCGLPLRQCPVWREALVRGFPDGEPAPPEVVRSQREIRTRHTRALVRLLRQGRMLEHCDYAPNLKGLYDGVTAATGARVIVDSSKFPVDAVVAAGLPGYEVSVVHMVRDPRAVAFSWQRRKQVADKEAGGGLLRRVGVVRSTAVWQGYNRVIERQVRAAVGRDRYVRLQYERLASEPAQVLAELVRFVGEPTDGLPVFHGNEVVLEPSHTASGNPNRFTTGSTAISLDSEWRSTMSPWSKATVTALSWPTLRRMGYFVRSSQPA